MPSSSRFWNIKNFCSLRVERLEDRLQPGSVLPWPAWLGLAADAASTERPARDLDLLSAESRPAVAPRQEADPVAWVAPTTGDQSVSHAAPPASVQQASASNTSTDLLTLAVGSRGVTSQPTPAPAPAPVQQGTPVTVHQLRTGTSYVSDMRTQVQQVPAQPVDLTADPTFFAQPLSFEVLGHWDNSDPGGSRAGTFWTTVTMISSGVIHGRAVTMDVYGNSYVTGWIEDVYGKYGFVEKFDLYGAYVWATAFNAQDLTPSFQYFDTEPHGIAVDLAGNTYITGTATRVGTTNRDAWAMKLTPDGSTVVYGHAYGSLLYQDEGNAIAVDNAGYVYVTGSNRPTLGQHEVIFVGRLRPSGQSFVYIQGYGDIPGYTTSAGNAMAFDPEEVNLYMSGWIRSNLTEDKDFFILKVFASNGSVGYAATTPGNVGNDVLDGIGVDSEGQAYVSGTLTVKGTTPHGYVAKLNTLGTDVLYASIFDDTNAGHGLALENNLAYVTGSANDQSTLDVFVVKMNSVGTVADAHFLEGSGDETGWGISFRYGLTAVSGNTTSRDLSTDFTYPLGTQDAFVSSIWWG